MLNVEPSDEEKLAGIEMVNKEVGHLGIAMKLGKDYGCDPQVIYDWEYWRVWNILKVEHMLRLFNERLQKVYEEKAKQKKRVVGNVFKDGSVYR